MSHEEFFTRVKNLVDVVDDYINIDNADYHSYERVHGASAGVSEDIYIDLLPESSNSTSNSVKNRKVNSPQFVPVNCNLSSLAANQECSRSTPNLLADDNNESYNNAECLTSSKHLMDSDGYEIVKHARSVLNISDTCVPSRPVPPVLPPRKNRPSSEATSHGTMPQPLSQKPRTSTIPAAYVQNWPSTLAKQTKHSLTPPGLRREIPFTNDEQRTATNATMLSIAAMGITAANVTASDFRSSHILPLKLNLSHPARTSSSTDAQGLSSPESDPTCIVADIPSPSLSEDDFVNVSDVLREHKLTQNPKVSPANIYKTMFLTSPSDSLTMGRRSPNPSSNRELAGSSSSSSSIHRSYSLSILSEPTSDDLRSPQQSNSVIGFIDSLFSAPPNTGFKYLQLGSTQQNIQSPTCEGWLYLGIVNKAKKVQWKKRLYCHLDTDELRMYSSKQHMLNSQARRVLKLDMLLALTMQNERELKLSLIDCTVCLKASNILECTSWLAALSQVMKGAQLSKTKLVTHIHGSLAVIVNGTLHKCFGVVDRGHLKLYSSEDMKKFLYGYDLKDFELQLESQTEADHTLTDTPSASPQPPDAMGLSEAYHPPMSLQSKPGTVLRVYVPVTDSQHMWCYYLCRECGTDLLTTSFRNRLLSSSDLSLSSRLSTKVPFTELSDNLVSCAKGIYNQIQMYTSTLITCTNEREMFYYIVCIKALFNKCMAHRELEGEFYSQIIWLISQDQEHNHMRALQGWHLMAMAMPIFLPTKPRELWWLENFIYQHCKSESTEIKEFACFCQKRLKRAEKNSTRTDGPTNCELLHQISQFPHPATKMMSLTVHLSTGDTVEVSYDSSTTVQEVSHQIVRELGLPSSSKTGFSLSCDWPGLEIVSEIHLHPLQKVCDITSQWSMSLGTHSEQRSIKFGYKKRVFLSSRVGAESERETILLAHQVNQSIVSTQCEVSQGVAIELAALLLQAARGPHSLLNKTELATVLEDAMYSYLPIVLVRDSLMLQTSHIKEKILFHWQQIQDCSKTSAVAQYLDIVRCLPWFGWQKFPVLQRTQSEGPVPVELAVGEDGIQILYLSRNETRMCSYQFVKSFGKSGDDFMLFLSGESLGVFERLIFSLPAVLLQELSLLVSTYVEVYLRTPQMPTKAN